MFKSRLFTALLILVAMTVYSAAGAQNLYSEYDDGSASFDYVQWPFGGMEGSFGAEGPVWDENLEFPEGQTNGCGGGISGAVNDTTRALAIAAIDNGDGTKDVGVIFVFFPNGPETGSFGVDSVNFTTGFAWINRVSNLTMPEEGDDYQAWFDNLDAFHKFGSTSGTIHVTAVGEDGFSGTFSGQMGDPDTFTLLTITNGVFDMIDIPTSAVPEAFSLAHLTAAPNPFNPQTTVKLAMEKDDSVVVGVYDVAGHRVARLFNGHLAQGEHQWVWSGMNDAGVKQSGGVYFCRAEGNGWQTSTKLILVP
ncbi:MAG: hypothetical protein GY780_07765 [bacterium]|nr:hypothetical protein [bacterium]